MHRWGRRSFFKAQVAKKGSEHEVLLEMIPSSPVQVAWANLLRKVQPELTQEFARHHDEQLCRCV